jgi:hypothetical protein
MIKTCFTCEHFWIATDRFDSTRIECMKRHYEGSVYEKGEKLEQMILSASTCVDYEVEK